MAVISVWFQCLLFWGAILRIYYAQEIPYSSISTATSTCVFQNPLNVGIDMKEVFINPEQDLVYFNVNLPEPEAMEADSSGESSLSSYLGVEHNVVDPFRWILARGEKGVRYLSLPFDFSMLSLGVLLDAGSSKKVPLDIRMSKVDSECFYNGSDSDRLFMLADILLNATTDAIAEGHDSICLERHLDGTAFVVDILLGTHISLQMNTMYTCWTRDDEGKLIAFDVQVTTPWLRRIMSLDPAWYHIIFVAVNLISSTLFVYRCGRIGKLVERTESKLDTFVRCARFLCLIHIIPTAVYVLTHYKTYCKRKEAAIKTNGLQHRHIDILHFFLCTCVIQLPIFLYKRSNRLFSRRTLMTIFFIISVFILTSVNVLYICEVLYFTSLGLYMYPKRVWLIVLLTIRSILIVRAVLDVHRFLRFHNNGLSFLQFVIKRGTQPEFSIFFMLSLVHTCAEPQTLSPVTIALLAALFINWIRYMFTPSGKAKATYHYPFMK